MKYSNRNEILIKAIEIAKSKDSVKFLANVSVCEGTENQVKYAKDILNIELNRSVQNIARRIALTYNLDADIYNEIMNNKNDDDFNDVIIDSQAVYVLTLQKSSKFIIDNKDFLLMKIKEKSKSVIELISELNTI
jgi:hypothetical protein